MRITFVSPPPNLSGGERVVAIYAKRLEALGHQVDIVCSRSKQMSWLQSLRAKLRGQTANASILETSHYEQYGTTFKVIDRDGPVTERDVPDADVIIATFWLTAIWMRDFRPSKGKKVYLVQHDEGTIHSRHPEAEATYALPMPHIYVSDWIRNRICSRHIVSNYVVIPNAVYVSDFDGGVRSKPTTPRVGMMWSSATIKGCDIALEAVSLARSELVDLELVSFGTGALTEEQGECFTQYVRQPAAEEMAQIYQSCTGWLFPSRFEGYGLPILEAMAARTPVVGADTGAAAELLASGGGLVVPTDDPDAMCAAIVEVCRYDDKDWLRMSESAYTRCKSWTWDDATALLESYICSCAAVDF